MSPWVGGGRCAFSFLFLLLATALGACRSAPVAPLTNVRHILALPAGAGSMDPGVFRRSAPGWLTPALHGVLDNWRVWAEEAG